MKKSEHLIQYEKGIKKMNSLILNAKKERDTKGYRENLGYDSENKLRNYLETLEQLVYSEVRDIIQSFYKNCEGI